MDPIANTVPNFQDLPFPAPLWLLQILLIVGFFTHVVPMNVALAGGAVSSILLGNKKDSYAYKAGLTASFFITILYISCYYTRNCAAIIPSVNLWSSFL